MNLHEYQAKQLFADYGIAIPRGSVANSGHEARSRASELGGSAWVVKAQVHAGGRGKAGGVKLVTSLDEVENAAKAMLGQTLVTPQTGSEGLPIHQVIVEETSDIAQELYLGALIDRAEKKIVFMASASGGMNIEEVAATTPEKILSVHVDPAAGLQGYQCRQLGFGLGFDGSQIKMLSHIMFGLFRLFSELDVSLVEINPLIIKKDGSLMALDAKINIDDNALYRHPNLQGMRDASQEDEKEYKAAQFDLNYITLEGNIGCMVNGAGLAMATMDLVKLQGGSPANFLDVGGGATKERVREAFLLILSDDKVKAILVNIFGGIVRCDLIAEGIIAAVQEVHMRIPVVVRLEGTNVVQGRQLLADSGLDIIAAENLTQAAEKVVALAV